MRSNTSFRMTSVLRTACVALAILAAPRVEAAELNTAVLRANGSTFVDYRCQLTNVGDKPITGTLTMFNSTGTELSHINFTNLGFGLTSVLTRAGTEAGGGRCLASGAFSKNKVIMTLQLIDTGSGITQVVVPGQ